MRCNSRHCRPLLRGLLVILGRWQQEKADPAFERRYATLAVWCPHCATFHYHGWDTGNDGTVLEHRVEHCHDPASPFHKSGYWIGTLRRSDPGYSSHVVKPGTVLRRAYRGRPTALELDAEAVALGIADPPSIASLPDDEFAEAVGLPANWLGTAAERAEPPGERAAECDLARKAGVRKATAP